MGEWAKVVQESTDSFKVRVGELPLFGFSYKEGAEKKAGEINAALSRVAVPADVVEKMVDILRSRLNILNPFAIAGGYHPHDCQEVIAILESLAAYEAWKKGRE